jgi:hypothetical protein
VEESIDDATFVEVEQANRNGSGSHRTKSSDFFFSTSSSMNSFSPF